MNGVTDAVDSAGRAKPRLAVHRFGGCGGCALALLGGDGLPALLDTYAIAHWPELGVSDVEAEVEVALVEGSVSTPAERDRLRRVRASAAKLVTIGVCANAGGPQALRALAADGPHWPARVYQCPEALGPLDLPAAVASRVRVDHALWGCPVDAGQVRAAMRHLAEGIAPADERRSVCAECKLAHAPCLWVRDGAPCLGPVTRAGCGGLCPQQGRACYGCFGPAADAAAAAFSRGLAALGLAPEEVARRLHFLASGAPPFQSAGYEPRHLAGPETP